MLYYSIPQDDIHHSHKPETSVSRSTLRQRWLTVIDYFLWLLSYILLDNHLLEQAYKISYSIGLVDTYITVYNRPVSLYFAIYFTSFDMQAFDSRWPMALMMISSSAR